MGDPVGALLTANMAVLSKHTTLFVVIEAAAGVRTDLHMEGYDITEAD